MTYNKHLLTFIVTSFAALPILAQEQSSEKNNQEADTAFSVQVLEPLEIKGVRASSTAPFAQTTLFESDLETKNNAQDIPYLLSHTPSVIINSDAGAGIGYTDMRIRGTDNQRINYTFNGIPVNDAESQGTYFVNFPDLISSTNSIQIQRGAGTSTNGPGAFGASVNISNIQQSNLPEIEIINSIGSFKTLRNTILANSGRVYNNWNFNLRLSHLQSDGYINRSNSKLKGLQFLTGWTSDNQKTNIKFNLITGKEKTGQAWNGVSEEMLSKDRQFNELGIKEDGTYYNDQTDNYQQDYYQLFFNHIFNDKWSGNLATYLTRGRGYYNEYKIDESYSDYNLADYVQGNDTLSTTSLIRQLWLDNYFYGITYGLHYKLNKFNSTLGGNISQYDGKHYGNVKWAYIGIPYDYSWYHNTAHKNDFNIYSKSEYAFTESLYGYFDLQYRYVLYTINGFRKNPEVRQNLKYNFINPKLGISYYKGQSKFYTSIAVASKEPNRDDLEANISDIAKPEKLYDLELGYQFRSYNLNLGANYYYMYYKDQLILTGKINDVGAYTRINTPVSYRTGIELFGNGALSKTFLWRANMTLSKNKLKSITDYVDNYDVGEQEKTEYNNTDIAFSPNTLIFAEIEAKLINTQKHKFNIAINGNYVGKQFLDNTQNNDKSIDPYSVANLSLKYKLLNTINKEIYINALANNLFNSMYVSKGYTFSYIYDGVRSVNNYYYPQAGINFLLTIGMKF